MGKVKNWTVEKKDEIEKMLITMWATLGMDIPSNYEDIVQDCYEDVCETADPVNWHSGDVAIAFRRWIESKECTTENVQKSTTKMVWVCTNCNSDNVLFKAWVNPNNDFKFDNGCTDGQNHWCDDCQTHSELIQVELKSDAKVIGFQVVGEECTDADGSIHPDMEDSFSVYSLSQCNEMIGTNEENAWRLQTIWEGDIEEPQIMFSGDPRE